MTSHLYLPEFKANIGRPDRPGVWHGYDPKILRGVGGGIVVGDADAARGVSSVPDVWARPLLFQNALPPDSGHPMRERLLQEWRGLLSLLALHEIQPYELQVTPVPLDGGTFANALRRLSPAPVALEGNDTRYEWTDLLLIRCEGIPVGAFSPTTLVYTSADYGRRLLAEPRVSLKGADGLLAPPGPTTPRP